MAISAEPVQPHPIDVAVAADSAQLKDLKETVPVSVTGISARMTETAQAGVLLAKFVLWIVVGSIAGLLLYLVGMDLMVAQGIEATYQKVYSVGAVGSELETLRAIEKFKLNLLSVETDPAVRFSADEVGNAATILTEVALLPSVSELQRSSLKACNPPPTDANRRSVIDRCLDLLDRLRDGIVAQASSVAHSQAAAEAANKIGEQRAALHTFWVQIAQLILLNLLLPLLTALFGYVFGTQQAQRQ